MQAQKSAAINAVDSKGFDPTALRKAKIAYNFGLSECNRVKNLRVNPMISEVLHEKVF